MKDLLIACNKLGSASVFPRSTQNEKENNEKKEKKEGRKDYFSNNIALY